MESSQGGGYLRRVVRHGPARLSFLASMTSVVVSCLRGRTARPPRRCCHGWGQDVDL